MINRVLIRLKIIQIVYAYYQNGSKNLDAAEKELFFCISKAYDLYNYLLLLMLSITQYAQKKNRDSISTRLKTEEQKIHQVEKFLNNKFIQQLEANKQLAEFITSQKQFWESDPNLIKSLYEDISKSDIFDQYINSPESSYEQDRELWRKLYKAFIFNNDAIDQVLEDQSLYWNDDKDIVDTFVLKTIKRFEEKNGSDQELLPEFKDEDDREFARSLFRKTILNADHYRQLISENTKNWDMERIALMDIIIMQTALAEILSFPQIPTNVSLNEYVELAKHYSTKKSGSFINGTLDGIVNILKGEGKLIKN